MYKVLYYRNHADQNPIVIHDTESVQNVFKLSKGTLKQYLNKIDEFEFELSLYNLGYGQIEPVIGLVEVYNTYDKQIEFKGRVWKPKSIKDNRKPFLQSYVAVSLEHYLNDSVQSYLYMPNSSVYDYLNKLIQVHNSQVEPHKQMRVGRVTVGDGVATDRFIGYQTTFETIRSHLVDGLGGVVKVRHTPDGMFLDYLKESDAGRFIDVPIKVGEVVKSARREMTFDGVGTIFYPTGKDLEQDKPEVSDDVLTTRPRVTITSVNNGSPVIEDTQLIRRYGRKVIPIEFPDIDNAQTLLARTQQYRNNQNLAMSSWTLNVLDRYLESGKYQRYEVGNYHEVSIPEMAGREALQIIEKTINILRPHNPDILVGADPQTLTKYQLQLQQANKATLEIANKVRNQQTLTGAIQSEIERLQTDLATANTAETIAELERRIQELESQLGGV